MNANTIRNIWSVSSPNKRFISRRFFSQNYIYTCLVFCSVLLSSSVSSLFVRQFSSVVLLNVLGCRLTYYGQVVTNAEARFNNSLRPRIPEGSLGRTAQDVHLDSHTAPELWHAGRIEECPFVNTFRARHTDVYCYHAQWAFTIQYNFIVSV